MNNRLYFHGIYFGGITSFKSNRGVRDLSYGCDNQGIPSNFITHSFTVISKQFTKREQDILYLYNKTYNIIVKGNSSIKVKGTLSYYHLYPSENKMIVDFVVRADDVVHIY